jgi:hypothetical protein
LNEQVEMQNDFEHFVALAPELNPLQRRITGVVCGVRVEAIEDATTQEIHSLDKLIDELARGKSMDAILRASKRPLHRCARSSSPDTQGLL